MTTYHNLRELTGHVLAYGDHVKFGMYTYIVENDYLYASRSNSIIYCDNETIFEKLVIDKGTFCDKYYGYKNDGGGWPESKHKDFAALTRVVMAIYHEIEKLPKQYFCPVSEICPEVIRHIKSISKQELPIILNTGYLVYSADEIFHSNNKSEFPFAEEYGPMFTIKPDITGKSITLKSTTHESKFQRKKTRVERGTRPEGSTVCGRRSKASVAVGHLSYRKVIGC